jgi:hypothetical protein
LVTVVRSPLVKSTTQAEFAVPVVFSLVVEDQY